MIQIKNICKDYLTGENEVHALKNVSINFRDSEFVSILGPSGCGKTTLLNIIGGLDHYSSGDIIIDGVSTKEYKDKDWDAYRSRYIGFIFQSYNLIGHLSVLENVELALTIAGIDKKEKRERALEALKDVGLENLINKKPNQLSGGQMQRVAIARAIVNKPKIILADEPTGALDSDTSIQVMDILKRISKKYLIIMVTHNEELAKQYSLRIITAKDGKIISDSNPYNPTPEEVDQDIQISENEKNGQKKSAMSYLTAFFLSIRNLWSKKSKTIIESLAGSIGIIGIALILAVSAGVSGYISNLQKSTLSNHPVSISTITYNMDYFLNPTETEKENFSEDGFSIYDKIQLIGNAGQINILDKNFTDYMESEINKHSLGDETLVDYINYDYGLCLQLLRKEEIGNSVSYKRVENLSSASTLSASSSSAVYQILDNKKLILDNYDVVAGKYSNSPDEIMLVVGSNNKIEKTMVENFGFSYSLNDDYTFADIKFSDVLNKEYVLMFNNALYEKIEHGSEFLFQDVKEQNYQAIYDSAKTYSELEENDNSLKLKISGILRLKQDSNNELLSAGLCYTKQLADIYAQKAKQSEIVQYAEGLIEATGKTDDDKFAIQLPWKYSLAISELAMYGITESDLTFDSTQQMKNSVKLYLNKDLTYEQCYQIALQKVGASDLPYSINYYPSGFSEREVIVEIINDWNKADKTGENHIYFSDTSKILLSALNSLVDVISIVLVAFAGISLVVSSVMIGIITYSSVIERTKEIGVLRSIGARKKDISRIFNSETILIGFFSGFLGVFITWILTFPISAIVKNLIGGGVTESLAVLSFPTALILILVSTLLTAIAGTVPAKIASKKDPVECLRSE